VPPRLPPDINVELDLATRLSAADRALGVLSGAGRVLPNPHPLSQALLRREAVLSSRIEGTQASLSDLVLSRRSLPARNAVTSGRFTITYPPQLTPSTAIDACRSACRCCEKPTAFSSPVYAAGTALCDDLRSRVAKARSSGLLGALVDHLFISPAITITGAANLLGVTHRAARLNIDKLVDAGVLTELGDRPRYKLFLAESVLEAIQG
jgi:Fic family protein